MRRPRMLLGAARCGCWLLLLAGCSAVEPRAVSPDLSEPVFASGWLLACDLSLFEAMVEAVTGPPPSDTVRCSSADQPRG